MLESLVFWLVAGVPLVLLVFLITSGLFGKLFPKRLSAYTLTMFGLAWAGTVLALGLVISNGPVNFSLIKTDQFSIVGLLADRLSLVILLLVTTVSGVVHLYSLRAMQEERHFARYFWLLSLVTVEVMVVVLANNLLMLSIFWIGKGLTLTFLLAHYQERAASWRAALTKLRLDLLGAISMLLALIVCWQTFGTFDIAVINRLASQPNANLSANGLTLMTLLLFVAAMVKSAQFPFHVWLPQSVEAPTPVSALMHAGLINAGGFLLVRLSPLFVAAPYTLALVTIVGGFTAFYGTLIMLTRNDVKGKLVYSTMGQMGFMMLECGLGAFALATFHIVAHGLFKATQFLSSGSVIQKKATLEHLAPGHAASFSKIQVFFMAIVATLLLFLLPLAFGWSLNAGVLLLAFAWVTLLFALPKLTHFPLWVGLVGMSAFILVYVAAVMGIESFFAPAMAPMPNEQAGLVIVGSVALMAAGLTLLLGRTATRPVWLRQWLSKLYVRLLFTGYHQ